jgi:transposase
MQTLISQYRQVDPGELFQASRPGPKRQPKKDAARERVLELRRARQGIEQIVAELERAGTPLSRTAVWEILREEGLSRMPTLGPAKPQRAPERLPAEKVRVLGAQDWPTEGQLQTQHAGLFLLIPELVALDLPGLVKEAGCQAETSPRRPWTFGRPTIESAAGVALGAAVCRPKGKSDPPPTGHLSAAVGCVERTVQQSPAVTTAVVDLTTAPVALQKRRPPSRGAAAWAKESRRTRIAHASLSYRAAACRTAFSHPNVQRRSRVKLTCSETHPGR